jgi:hypothetical protein
MEIYNPLRVVIKIVIVRSAATSVILLWYEVKSTTFLNDAEGK